ncbi:carbohydrate ABC transporter permease [Lysinibacter cavernae]|uniref:ABC-type glycerol-3-phosphate transport system permease component n=1 Tax=Lysinibacter cavernae TaxID=1640652 RepID=A0A7X5R395_9MICO|nr:carbohydrate ABC transporter permease [Lysinibacter cavernae]NIH54811.1 ABC-type glycerol-3-phosphate transport system permease component [Lysinibacter cavernae]
MSSQSIRSTSAAAPAPRRRFHPRTLWQVPQYGMMIIVSLVCLVPVAIMLRIALTPQVDWRQMPIDWFQPATWKSFEQVLASPFLHSLLNSFIIALITTLIVVVLSAMGGHALARMRGKNKDRFLFVVLGTRMGPAVVFGLPIYLLASSIGLVDTYVGIIAVYIVYNLAFGIWMMHGFFLDIPGEVEEAGLMDGLSEWGVFRRVSLPMAASGVIATATLVFILTWNEFFYAFVLTQRTASTFPTTIPGYFGAFQVDWGPMFAASTLGILPPVIFGILARKWLAKGLSGGLVD